MSGRTYKDGVVGEVVGNDAVRADMDAVTEGDRAGDDDMRAKGHVIAESRIPVIASEHNARVKSATRTSTDSYADDDADRMEQPQPRPEFCLVCDVRTSDELVELLHDQAENGHVCTKAMRESVERDSELPRVLILAHPDVYFINETLRPSQGIVRGRESRIAACASVRKSTASLTAPYTDAAHLGDA